MTRKLANDCIEIWQADLNEYMFLKFNSYFQVLSKEEKENANSFKMDYHRKCYILSHVILRLLLSKYTGIIPELIEIHKNKYGKPFIKSDKLKFNMSHSKGKLAIAMASFEVGIDIEYINPNFDIYEIIDIALSESEKLNIKKLEFSLQKKQFYKYWTQKEAFLKAMGTGINMDLNKLEIPNNTSDNNRISIYKEKKWIIEPFNSFNKDYIGHIAYNDKNNKIIQYYKVQLSCVS